MHKHLKSELLDNDPRLLKQLCNKVIDLFFEHALDGKNYPLNDYSDVSLIDNNPFTKKGVLNVGELVRMIDKQILDQSIYRTKRNYLKFVDNGSSPINIIGSIINSLLNQNLTAHLTHSPSATFHEVALIKYVREIVGYPYKKITSINDIGGYFVSGGMMANFAALLVARNNIQPNAQSDGVSKKLKLIVPSFACHFSAWSSMGWLGYGENNTVHVKTNNFKYDLAELEKTIQSIKKDGDEILAVVASVGDSYSMSIENILEVRKICDRYNIWLHGDGANCGILVFAKKYRKYVKDFHLCDSVSLDPHKLLGMNYPNSIFLCKDYTKFNTVISRWNIIHKKGSFDLGMITPFLNSRGFDSLKLWLLLKYFGTEGVANIVDNKIDATQEIYRQLATIGNNILFHNNVETFSIIFQIIPDEFITKEVNEKMIEDLNRIQNGFIEFTKSREIIQIHSYKLPTSILHKEFALGGSSVVLCIHNGHETVDNKMMKSFLKSIREFLKQ